MGRFYQTDKPTFVDNKMLQLPYQLMGQVIGKVDSDISKNENSLLSLYDKLNANALQQDQPRLQEIFSQYESNIDELSKTIQDNPLEFRKKTGDIRKLGRRLHEDFTRGEISAIQGNFNKFQDFNKRGLESVKKGDVLQDDFNFAQNKFITDFQGTNFQDGSFDSIATEDLNKFIDVENLAETRGKDYAADVVSKLGAFSDGRFIYEDSSKTKKVPYEKVYNGVYSALLNDQELNSYLGQQLRLGKITPQQYRSTIVNSAKRVADKFSFSEQSTGRKLKNDQEYLENLRQKNRKNLAKFKKKLDEEEDLNFSPTFTRTSAMLDKDKFKYENIESFASSLKEDLQELKSKNISNFNEVELRSHNYNIDQKQAAVNRLESIRDHSIDGAYRRMLKDGKITEKDYENHILYEENKSNIDGIVTPVLDDINEQVLNMANSIKESNTALDSDVNFLDISEMRLKETLLKDRISSNPEFADAYEKYNAGKAMFKDLNKGESIQLIDGLAITLEKPNEYLNKWYKDNADANTLYNSAIGIDPTGSDSTFVKVLDDMSILNSAEVKVLSPTQNEFNIDGTINTKQINPSINEDTFFELDDESNFSLNSLLNKTGRKPSELFNIKGIEPSKSGVRVIYQYDEKKLKDSGIDEINGLNNGQQFILEVPNTGLDPLIRDKYSNNKNPKAVEVAKGFGRPVLTHISNEVDNIIKDITSDNFEQGPENTIFVGGLRLNVSSSKEGLYNIKGIDSTNSKQFNIESLSAEDLKINIMNYLDMRNKGTL